MDPFVVFLKGWAPVAVSGDFIAVAVAAGILAGFVLLGWCVLPWLGLKKS
jgi:hypothetical protein